MDSTSDVGEVSHTKRNIAIIVVLVLGAVGIVVVSGFSFGLSGCFGGIACFVSDSPTCSVQTKSCEMMLSNNSNSVDLVATACSFDAGNSTVQGRFLIASGGAPSTLELFPNSSIVLNCSYPGTPVVGSQVSGSVLFGSNGGVPFTSTWR